MRKDMNTEHRHVFVNGRRKCCRAVISILAAILLIPGQVYAEETEESGTAQTASPEATIPEKEETVYVIANPSGDVNKIIVSDWLKNPAKEETIDDETTLSGIENLKGEETWAETDEGGIRWDAAGNDIFYQGISDQELPVTMSVTCLLDGEEIAPEEMAGKSGGVTLRYQFENHAEKEVEIDGVKSTLHVPFMAVAVFMPDENTIKDLKVTNGCLVSDGDHTVVIGAAFPGLARDLETPAYAQLTGLIKTQVPDYIEITGQAEDFSWNTGYTLITNELLSFSVSDPAVLIDEIFGKLDALKGGVSQIAQGITSMEEGAEELKGGAKSLSEGLGKLTEQQQTICDGAEQIFESTLETVQEQLAQAGIKTETLTKENYADILETMTGAADEKDREILAAAQEKLESARAFSESLITYTDAVASAKEGADVLEKGAGTLKDSAWKLSLGSNVLNTLIPDLSGVPAALKETAALKEAYNNYAGLVEGMNGKVRFIWKVEGIGE